MRLTRAGEYAIRSLRFLASRPETRWFAIQEIAEAEEIPAQFLAKVMQRLAQSGLVQSACGKTGGYRLARPASEVTIADAVVAMEGPISLNTCLLYPRECRFVKECRMHPIWAEAQEAMLAVLKKHCLSEIIEAAPSDMCPSGQGRGGHSKTASDRGRASKKRASKD